MGRVPQQKVDLGTLEPPFFFLANWCQISPSVEEAQSSIRHTLLLDED
jgi:hypothetical protein